MRRGFTLLEVTLAVAIAGVLSAVAIPNFQRLVGKEHGAASIEEVADLIRYTSERARATLCPAHIESTSNQIQVWATKKAVGQPTCNDDDQKNKSWSGSVITFDQFQVDGSPQGTINFDKHGALTGTVNPVYLNVSLASGQKAKIEVWPGTGSVRVLW